MPPNQRKPPEPLSFEVLMQTVSAEFEQLTDHRRANARYELADMLRSAFAMFSLKSPSLLAFRRQLPAEKANLQTIYRIGAIPGDTQMRGALDPLDPAPLRALFARLFEHLRLAGVVTAYQYWRDHVIVAVDGVEHFPQPKFTATNARRAPTVMG